MDQLKHFSHNHWLCFHQVPQGSELRCSGCKSPGSGNFRVCWQCNYFLHEQCFRATRFLKHPSHPLHPLTLVPNPTYPSGSFICNSCNLSADCFSYTCSACEFDIHVHCALGLNPNPYPSPSPVPASAPNFSAQTLINPPPPQIPIYPPQISTIYPPIISANTSIVPNSDPPDATRHFSHPHVLKPIEMEEENGKLCDGCRRDLSGSVYSCAESGCSFVLHKACFDAPRVLHHKSHPHPLTMLTDADGFTCNACLQQHSAFAYVCAACSYHLHADCLICAEKISHPIHKHRLDLCYSVAEGSEDVSLLCGVCEKSVHPMAWRFCCSEQCGYRAHTVCAFEEVQRINAKPAKSSAETMVEQYVQMQELDLMMQMVQFNAQLMSNFGNW